jgi:voltage-gated potassium channel
MWFSVISYFTVGYGDYYPMTYPGRMVNTIIIIGGMTSSAIVIGLVHDAMELTNEEEHVFRFIKTRRKE